MILAGDELGHSQNGNNNAYCQDNETSWIDWRALDADNDTFLRFVQRVIGVRRSHPDFRRETFFSRNDIVWLHPAGREMDDDDWHDPNLSSFGCTFGEQDRFAWFFNASAEDLTFVPSLEPGVWECIVDSSDIGHKSGTVAAHSLMIFKKVSA